MPNFRAKLFVSSGLKIRSPIQLSSIPLIIQEKSRQTGLNIAY